MACYAIPTPGRFSATGSRGRHDMMRAVSATDPSDDRLLADLQAAAGEVPTHLQESVRDWLVPSFVISANPNPSADTHSPN